MKHLFTFLISLGVSFCVFSATPSARFPVNPCDTIFMADGKILLCQIVHQNQDEIQFSFCDDPAGKVYVISSPKVSSIALSKPDRTKEVWEKKIAPVVKPRPVKPVTPKPQPRQKHKRTKDEMASGAVILSVLSLFLTASLLFIPLGFIAGLFAVRKGSRLLERTPLHSKFKKIRRKAKWAIVLGTISMTVSVGLAIWLIKVINSWHSGFGSSDYTISGPIFAPW